MNLLTCILIAIPIGIIFIMLWIYNDYRKYKNLKSASNLNGNLNCSKELEHYAS